MTEPQNKNNVKEYLIKNIRFNSSFLTSKYEVNSLTYLC